MGEKYFLKIPQGGWFVNRNGKQTNTDPDFSAEIYRDLNLMEKMHQYTQSCVIRPVTRNDIEEHTEKS